MEIFLILRQGNLNQRDFLNYQKNTLELKNFLPLDSLLIE
jgi:hypothetical protein